MRIISGFLKGRKIDPNQELPLTRPTTDYAKQALFNILSQRFFFEHKNLLDLFAGTGNISFEFISRGVQDVDAVEQNPTLINFIQVIAQKFGVNNQIHGFTMDVFYFIETCSKQYDFIFCGPPYSLENISLLPDLIFKKNLLKELGVLILEHNPSVNFLQHNLLVDCRKYGTTIFSFFRNPC